MSLTAQLARLVRFARLSVTRRVEIGDTDYRLASTIGVDAFNKALSAETVESWMADVLRALPLDDGDFVDVGANVGQTLRAFLAATTDSRYWGFEPQVEAAATVQAFLVANDLARCTMLPVGLGSDDAFVGLHRSFARDSTASMVGDYRPADFHSSMTWVPVCRGDRTLSDLGVSRVSAIKIDVEGAELEVVQGLADTIEAHHPSILFEVLPNWLLLTGEPLADDVIEFRNDRTDRLSRLFDDSGYTVHQIVADDRSLTAVAELSSAPTGHDDTNFLAVHESDGGSILGRLAECGWTLG
jgi:FkbM family methyltransferase